MKLYYSDASPYARKVRVVARELGLADLIEDVKANPLEPTPELLAVNPLSKIPALVTGKGELLPDSSLIVEYLLTRGSGLAPLPRGGQRWVVLRRQWLAEGVMDAAVACAFEKRRPVKFQYPPFVERHDAAILRTLDALEAEADGLPLAEAVRIAEINVGVALAYLDLRKPELAWRTGRERLATWYRVFAERPSMLATRPVAS